jgi:hypothetical protein
MVRRILTERQTGNDQRCRDWNIALAVVVLAGGMYFYFATGMAPAATADPPMPFEKKLANMALNARIAKQRVGQPPVTADEGAYLAGAEVYKQQCASCHGLPACLLPTMRQPCIPSRRSCSMEKA